MSARKRVVLTLTTPLVPLVCTTLSVCEYRYACWLTGAEYSSEWALVIGTTISLIVSLGWLVAAADA